VLCFDMTFLPIVKAIWSHCKTVKQWIALCERRQAAGRHGIANLRSYEEWIAADVGRVPLARSSTSASAAALC